MNLRTSKNLTSQQVNAGLKLVMADGLMAEAMVVFTSGTFLTAMAIHMGATNFHIGMLSALPTFTTVFQLLSVWLVRRFKNRRVVAALFNLLARIPIVAIGLIPFLFSGTTSLQVLFIMLFFQHIFGDIAGASWYSWMKDLIPSDTMGAYFSRRTRLSQILNITLSLATALCMDYIKAHYPSSEQLAYNVMFLIGGSLGLISVGLLLGTPEPQPQPMEDKLMQLVSKPLKNKNFKKLVFFNSFWAFALNLATPFFSVYMMKTIGLPLSYIIGLGILGQISGIFSLKLWGKYSDWFSNKTIISICAPLYVACIIGFAFTAMPDNRMMTLLMLLAIHIVSGSAVAGINLALTNIGIKLAPQHEAIAYISIKNMFVAACSTIAPLIGGLAADFFATHPFVWNMQFGSSHGMLNLTLLHLQGWNYFFVIGGLLALMSLKFLGRIQEEGEVDRDRVVIHMRVQARHRMRKNLGRDMAERIYQPSAVVKRKLKTYRAQQMLKRSA
ncbi:MFS transporter [Mucilaginibacter koreensis]